jgi:hypothetical protein
MISARAAASTTRKVHVWLWERLTDSDHDMISRARQGRFSSIEIRFTRAPARALRVALRVSIRKTRAAGGMLVHGNALDARASRHRRKRALT